jgi:glucose/arabinose dehydrogenase
MDRLYAAVQEKNLQFFYDYRAVNGYYIYGGRKDPFGVVNFPAEFARLRKMIDNRDQRIWAVARGEVVPDAIDDSNSGDFVAIETNFQNEVHITTPEESAQLFTLPDGFEVNLFASEVDFPDLQNPVAFAFDARGRMYVTTMPSYPQYLPGTPVDDKVLIFEDTNRDGVADRQTVFARGLHLPAGIELGDGGAYVAQQPNLMFIQDTDGDDQADKYDLILHGFDSADSHHAISAFEWGPGGDLYFMEGTFHHTQVETPYGPTRVKDAAVFR